MREQKEMDIAKNSDKNILIYSDGFYFIRSCNYDFSF